MDIIGWLRARWEKYQEDKKWHEFYARLDRNKAGKFSKNKYMRDIKTVVKSEKNKK